MSAPRPPPPSSVAAAAAALRALPPGEQPLSPAARAFNLQLTRVDKLKAQLDELDALGACAAPMVLAYNMVNIPNRETKHAQYTPLRDMKPGDQQHDENAPPDPPQSPQDSTGISGSVPPPNARFMTPISPGRNGTAGGTSAAAR